MDTAELVADQVAIPAGRTAKVGDANRTSPGQLLVVLRQNWPVMLAFGLTLAIAAYVVSKVYITPRFTAEGVVAVEMRSFAIPELQGVLANESSPDPIPLVRSEVQVLQSRALMESVVKELNLTDDPEFNGSLRPPSFFTQMSVSLRDALPASLSTPLVNAGLLPQAQSEPASPADTLSNVVDAVEYNLAVTNDGRSLVINVDFLSEQPDLSAKVVNTLIDRYMAASQDARALANHEANIALEKRIQEVHGEVGQLETRIQDMRQKYNLVQVRAGSVGQQQLEDLSAGLAKASADRAQAEANFQRAAVLVRTGGAAGDGSDPLSSSIVGALRDREATAERHLAQVQATFGPGHPSTIEAQAELASARSAVAIEAKRAMAGLGAQASAARQREDDLRAQLAKAQVSATSLSSVQTELEQLEKDADARRTLYQTLMERAEQTQANKEGPEQSGARVVSLAVPPTHPSSPRPKLAAALGLISGFAFGGLISLAVRRGDLTYANANEVIADTGLAMMGVLPRTKDRGVSLPSRIVDDPTGLEAEALRSFRVRLRLAGRGSVPRSVLFVSSTADEKGSTMAAAFARVASLDGLRVLLIEGDLQTPTLAKTLGVTPNSGLIETLNGGEHWPECLSHDSATLTDLLLAGNPQPAASQLLESMQLQSLMAEVQEDYNLVVVDGCSPATQGASLKLASLVDAVAIVIEARRTPRERARSAIMAISEVTRRQPLVVLDNVI